MTRAPFLAIALAACAPTETTDFRAAVDAAVQEAMNE